MTMEVAAIVIQTDLVAKSRYRGLPPGVLVHRFQHVLPEPSTAYQQRCCDVVVPGAVTESHGVKLWLPRRSAARYLPRRDGLDRRS